MSRELEELVDAFVSRLDAQVVTIRRDDNTARLRDFGMVQGGSGARFAEHGRWGDLESLLQR